MRTPLHRRLRVSWLRFISPARPKLVAPMQRDADRLLELVWRQRVAENEKRRRERKGARLRIVEDDRDLPAFLRRQASL